MGLLVARRLNHGVIGMIAGAFIISAALGVRQTFGLFIGPFSYDHGLPVTLVAFAIALHNLVWGFTQPFAGAAADRHGAAPVVAFGAIVFAAGLAIAGHAASPLMLVLSMGVLVGVGVSCTAFGVIMPAVGAWRRRRSAAWRWAWSAPRGHSAESCSCHWRKASPNCRDPRSRSSCSPAACCSPRRSASSSIAAAPRARRSRTPRTFRSGPRPRRRWGIAVFACSPLASSRAASSWRSSPRTCPTISSSATCRSDWARPRWR